MCNDHFSLFIFSPFTTCDSQNCERMSSREERKSKKKFEFTRNSSERIRTDEKKLYTFKIDGIESYSFCISVWPFIFIVNLVSVGHFNVILLVYYEIAPLTISTMK